MKKISVLTVSCYMFFSVVSISTCSSSMKGRIIRDTPQKAQMTAPIFQPQKQRKKSSAPKKIVRKQQKSSKKSQIKK